MFGNLAIETASSESSRITEQGAVKLLDSTVVELEVAHAISSKDMRTGDAISFLVACPVIVDGVTVIAAGAMAMGIITGVEKYGRYNQPDKIAWDVKEVIAVDGTSIPLQQSVSLSCSEHSRTDQREMAAASLMFPGGPLALLLLSRQRGNWIVRAGERFRAFVRGDFEVRSSPQK